MTELPNGWVAAQLDELADVRLGRQRSPKNHVGARMRPYLRAANIRWSGLDLSDVKEMNFSASESETYELRPGDVLVAEASGSANEVGKPALWRGEIAGCCFQNTIVRVRSAGPLPDYLRYLILAEARSGRIGAAAPGVGIHHIGSSRLAASRVAVPPLNEQRRIVAAIEEHFSRLDAADRSLTLAMHRLSALRRATLAAAVAGHESVGLGSVVCELRYGTSIKCSYDGEGPAVVRIPNVQGGKTDLSDLKFSTTNADLSLFVLEQGDILIVRTNGSRDLIGRVASVDGAEGMAFASYLIRARLDRSRLDSRFAVLALSAPDSRALIESKAATTAGQYNLNLASLRSLPVPLPSIDEQRVIVAEVDERLVIAEAMNTAIRRALHNGAALRRSILDRAVRGELVPQDLSDEPASLLLERIRAQRETAPSRPRRRRVGA